MAISQRRNKVEKVIMLFGAAGLLFGALDVFYETSEKRSRGFVKMIVGLALIIIGATLQKYGITI